MGTVSEYETYRLRAAEEARRAAKAKSAFAREGHLQRAGKFETLARMVAQTGLAHGAAGKG